MLSSSSKLKATTAAEAKITSRAAADSLMESNVDAFVMSKKKKTMFGKKEEEKVYIPVA